MTTVELMWLMFFVITSSIYVGIKIGRTQGQYKPKDEDFYGSLIFNDANDENYPEMFLNINDSIGELYLKKYVCLRIDCISRLQFEDKRHELAK